jgi:hypothetical protein
MSTTNKQQKPKFILVDEDGNVIETIGDAVASVNIDSANTSYVDDSFNEDLIQEKTEFDEDEDGDEDEDEDEVEEENESANSSLMSGGIAKEKRTNQPKFQSWEIVSFKILLKEYEMSQEENAKTKLKSYYIFAMDALESVGDTDKKCCYGTFTNHFHRYCELNGINDPIPIKHRQPRLTEDLSKELSQIAKEYFDENSSNDGVKFMPSKFLVEKSICLREFVNDKAVKQAASEFVKRQLQTHCENNNKTYIAGRQTKKN